MPSAVALNGSQAGGGFLGAAHQRFAPNGRGRGDMKLQNGLTLERLSDREALLGGLDQLRRQSDDSALMDGLDKFNKMAFEVVTSTKLADALDINKAEKESVERYHKGVPSNMQRSIDVFLTARRLVEAGVRCVTLNSGGWDTHSNNFKTL